MTYDEAKAILSDAYHHSHRSTYIESGDPYISWHSIAAEHNIRLDGRFDTKTLEAIITIVRAHGGE